MSRASRAEEVQTERRRRPSGPNQLAGLKLSVPAELLDPNFQHRWANENDRRLNDLTQHDDYDFVMDPGKVKTDGEGTPVTKIVGTKPDGSPLKAYLIRKPKKYYDADRKEALKPIAETEDQIRRGLNHTKIEPGLAGVSYTPSPVPGESGTNIIDGR